ncbi:hypothetical protein NDU88_006010 [Pleurodeles waltl]|uniref:Uncharacterized protein n=1 Tax=Pleurodeles waltl TaxID=8319 RepID=A0AAV7N1T5_PLEWA|nr:hypothetical protein NDU88_006010 [Pleurodeles waltl]
MRPRRRMATWRGPSPDLLPPGAAAGLKSARPLCALRSSTHGHTPQKPPRASTLVRPHRGLSARARPSAGPPASFYRCSDLSAAPEPPKAAQGLL